MHTILNILTKYCIFTSENLLFVIRPYQSVAAEHILNRIEIAHNYKKYGTIEDGSYIWHRTGSIKTTGTDIDRILPAVSRFGGGNHKAKKETVIEKLKAFFERFWNI